MVSIEAIKLLRQRTGMSLADCRRALLEAGDDVDGAIKFLEARGSVIAGKKSGRETHEGRIGSYVHGMGKIAVLVEIHCETDFVARNELFGALLHEIAMQVAAMNPETVEALLMQERIRDPGKQVGEHLVDLIARLGENIKIARFVRWEL